MTKEDIEKEADKRYKHPHIDNMDASGHQAFCEGASWMQEQFENNRLAHCDGMTPEQAEREMDFVNAFIKEHNRTPTFSDCIEITRKETIDKACEWLYECVGIGEEFKKTLVGKFRKAMEEQV